MSKPTGDSSDSMAVHIFKVANRLKGKLGVRPVWSQNEPGHIDPKLLKEADALIADRCTRCPAAIDQFLGDLSGYWVAMRDMPQSKEREELSEKVYMLAHEIKDIAALCGYDLAAHFAESLRDYIGQTELNLNAQRVIIQAHIDAMTVVSHQGIKSDGGPAAEELKKMVKVAIEKYS